MIEIDNAITIGLLFNELITNSLKHAFDGISKPEIYIYLQKYSKEKIKVSIRDNGVGLPENFIELSFSNLYT